MTVRQLQEQLPELLDRAVEDGEECVVQRNGKDYAVIVSAREWRRRSVGRLLDGPGLVPPVGRETGTDARIACEESARAAHPA